MHSVVFAPPAQAGGVKSLYSDCEWLDRLGTSRIQPFGPAKKLAEWFEHRCSLFDRSYEPELVVYPEICQPDLGRQVFHICFALGKHQPIEAHADLVVCRSRQVKDWVHDHAPQLNTHLIVASIDRRPFEYDGRRKQRLICYFTRPGKYPEMAKALRNRYGNCVIEIQNRTECEVAEILKDASVVVWRGNDKEGSPRPPKEALVAGCVVVGLEQDLNPDLRTDFGVRYQSLEELMAAAGAALNAPMPSAAGRAVVRDSEDERKDWELLINRLSLRSRSVSKQST